MATLFPHPILTEFWQHYFPSNAYWILATLLPHKCLLKFGKIISASNPYWILATSLPHKYLLTFDRLIFVDLWSFSKVDRFLIFDLQFFLTFWSLIFLWSDLLTFDLWTPQFMISWTKFKKKKTGLSRTWKKVIEFNGDQC